MSHSGVLGLLLSTSLVMSPSSFRINITRVQRVTKPILKSSRQTDPPAGREIDLEEPSPDTEESDAGTFEELHLVSEMQMQKPEVPTSRGHAECHGCKAGLEESSPKSTDSDVFAFFHSAPEMQNDSIWTPWQGWPMAGPVESNPKSHNAVASAGVHEDPKVQTQEIDATSSDDDTTTELMGGGGFHAPGPWILDTKKWNLDPELWHLDPGPEESNRKSADAEVFVGQERKRQLKVESAIQELRTYVAKFMKTEFVQKWIPGHVAFLSAEDWYKPYSIWKAIDDLSKELDKLRHDCPYEFEQCIKDTQIWLWQELVKRCRVLQARIPRPKRRLAIRVQIFNDVKKLQMNLKLKKLEHFAFLGWASSLGAVGDLANWLEGNQEWDWIHDAEVIKATEWYSLSIISWKIDDLAKKLQELSSRRQDESILDMQALVKGLQAALAKIPRAARRAAIKVGISNDVKLLQRKLKAFVISGKSRRDFGEWLENQNQERDFQGRPFHEIRRVRKLEKDPVAAYILADLGLVSREMRGQVAEVVERLHARRQELFELS